MTDFKQYLPQPEPDEESDKKSSSDYLDQPPVDASRFTPEIELLQEGRQEWEKGNNDKAVNAYEMVLQKYPHKFRKEQLIELALQIADLHYGLSNFEMAVKFAQQINNSADHSHQRDRANQILGRVAVSEYRFKEADDYFSLMTKDGSFRQHPGTLLGKISVYLKCRQTKRALSALSDLERDHINPSEKPPTLSANNPEYLVYRSYIRLLMGSTEQALTGARDLVPRCQRDVHLSAILAEIFLTAGQYQESERLADEVLRRCPKNDQALATKAHLFYARQDFAAARSYASKACQVNPRNFYARIIFMKLSARDERYVEAERLGEKILLECPDFALVHAVLGDIYFDQDKGKEALIHYEHTNDLMVAPTKGGHLRQARIFMIRGEYGEAIKILEPLVNVTHTYSDEAMTDLLVCYDVLNEAEKATSLWEKMEIRKAFYHRMGRVMETVGKGSEGTKGS